MALPKVKYPVFVTNIPSTGKEVEFRPFTVAEEKVLVTALEGEDMKEILISLDRVIEACFKDVDASKLASFDLEYLFAYLRAKSVSEIVELEYKHVDSDKPILVRVDITEAKVKYTNETGDNVVYDAKTHKDYVTIADGLTVQLKWPTAKEIYDSTIAGDVVEETHNLAKKCIVAVADEETVYDEFTKEEMDEWYNNLMSSDKQKIVDYIENLPTLTYSTWVNVPDTDKKEEIRLEGLSDFFD